MSGHGRAGGADGRAVPLGRRFLVVWAGQTVSAIGSTVSGVGVAVYAYVETGDARTLGLLTALAAVPYVVAGPFTKHIDRVGRRTVMIAADTVAAAGTIVALVLALVGRLEIWHLVVASVLAGLGTAFQFPAWQAAIPSLVSRAALDRANGAVQIGPAMGVVVGPIVATPLVHWFGIASVLLVDVATFAVAVVATAAVRFEDPPPADRTVDDGSWRAAVRWLRGSGRPVAALLALMATTNFVIAFANVGMLVIATDVGGDARAGLVLGAGGVGMLAGSALAGRRGLGRDRVLTIARGYLGFAVGVTLLAARPTFWLVLVGAFVALVPVPSVGAAASTLFHELVPPTMQGRVFGLRLAVGRSFEPVGSIVAGVLISQLAGPAMAPGGWLAGSLGAVLGVGGDRGAAVVLLASGLVIAMLGAWVAGSSMRRGLVARPAPA